MAGLLAIFAEFEREILRERVKAGIDHARKKGGLHGRPATTKKYSNEIKALFNAGMSKSEIAKKFEIGRTSVRRILDEQKRVSMKQLMQPDFYKVKNLYSKDIPNYPVVMAIIEGNNPGKIWVDNVEHPSQSLVISSGSYSFISGDTVQASEETLNILIANKPIKLIYDINNAPHFSLDSFEKINRIQFYYPENSFAKCKQFMSQTPTGFEIRPIDNELFKKSNWYNYLLLFYGSIENYVKNGFGYCLVKEGQIISEAHACYVGGGMVETGSVTHEDYRNNNLATIVRAHLINECLSRHLIPISSCDEANIGSARVSQKLGFKEQLRYQFLRLV